ncbi:hypothetical protein OJAV_G00070910 [Oryzias javanicus]|uniref:Mid2 domain-containing protein n=1 Tax=Oryzias javanicus TaxID=123683 RepID=A0A3S2UHI4_ORYJA|nr:hypothetical protein OJAV_G00070910 [Oryzias javanicus]
MITLYATTGDLLGRGIKSSVQQTAVLSSPERAITNDVTLTPKPTFKPSSKRTFESTTTSSSAKSRTNTAALQTSATHPPGKNTGMIAGIIAAGIVAACIIVGVMFLRWKRTSARKRQNEEILTHPEDGVNYVSIRFSKKTNNRRQVPGDAVTYSTVKVSSSSSAHGHTDSESLYVSIY